MVEGREGSGEQKMNVYKLYRHVIHFHMMYTTHVQ